MFRAHLRRTAAQCLLGLGIVMGWATQSRAEDVSQVSARTSAQDDVAIVSLRLRGAETIAENMLVRTDGEAILLPLGEVIAAIGFPIGQAHGGAVLEGWFLREAQTVRIDADAREAIITGAKLGWSDTIRRENGETFVPLDTLNAWFGLNASYDSFEQVVRFDPAYALPAEARARRAMRLAGNGYRPGSQLDFSALTQINPPRPWLGAPFGAFSVTSQYNDQSNQRTRSTAGSLRLTGDVLKMTGDLNTSFDAQGRRNAALTLRRDDAAGGLFAERLGGRGLTQIALGDVQVQALPFSRSGTQGVGVSLRRGPLERGSAFSVTTIDGEAMPGWQVELYRESELIGFLTTSQSGRYQFADAPLLFGVNRFRIELYGPNGERRTEERIISIADSFLAPGEVTFGLDVAAIGRGVFTNRQDPARLALSGPLAADTVAADGLALTATSGFGLTKTLSMSLGARLAAPEIGAREAAFSAGLRWRIQNVAVTLDAGVQNGAAAGRLSAATGLGPLTLSLSHDQYSPSFLRETNPNTREAGYLSQTSVRADAPLGGADGRWGQISLSGSALERVRGREQQAQARLSTRIAMVSVASGLTWRGGGLTGLTSDPLQSTIALSGPIGPLRVRAALQYDIRPARMLRSQSLSLAWRQNDWEFRLDHDDDRVSRARRMGFGVSRDFNGVRFGIEASRAPLQKETRAQATLSFEFDRDPLGGGMRYGRNARSGGGSAQVRVFEDRDRDGRFGLGDEVIEGAEVIVEPRARAIGAGPMGGLFDDLTSGRVSGFAINPDSLADPFLSPVRVGVKLTPRPGGVTLVELPVEQTGAVEIEVRDSNGAPQPGAIVALEACDKSAPPQKVRTAFDGLAIFERLQEGCYNAGTANETVKITVVSRSVARVGIALSDTTVRNDLLGQSAR